MSRKKKAPRQPPEYQWDPPDKAKPEELEAQADAILAKDHMDLAAEVRRNTELIEQIYKDLRQPSNDPTYLAALQARDKTRQELANKIDLLHLVPDPAKNRTWISAAFPHGEGEEMARLMQEHFEAKLQRYEGPTE